MHSHSCSKCFLTERTAWKISWLAFTTGPKKYSTDTWYWFILPAVSSSWVLLLQELIHHSLLGGPSWESLIMAPAPESKCWSHRLDTHHRVPPKESGWCQPPAAHGGLSWGDYQIHESTELQMILSGHHPLIHEQKVHIWFTARRDDSFCFLDPLKGLFIWRPGVSRSPVFVTPPGSSAEVHSTMWNAQGCEVTVGSHLNQKTGICQAFIHQQTIPQKYVPVSHQFPWGRFGQESDELVLGIRMLFGHMGAEGETATQILILGMSGGLCNLAAEITNSQILRIVLTHTHRKKGATFFSDSGI